MYCDSTQKCIAHGYDSMMYEGWLSSWEICISILILATQVKAAIACSISTLDIFLSTHYILTLMLYLTELSLHIDVM